MVMGSAAAHAAAAPGPMPSNCLLHGMRLRQPYTHLLKEQAAGGMSMVRGISPPRHGCTIVIRQNRIQRIIAHEKAHRIRLAQYVKLFNNTCERRVMPDCELNINLVDFPIAGYFNFCRLKGHVKQLLLPNHRFTIDDVYPTSTPLRPWLFSFATYDEQLANLTNDAPFDSKIPRAFMVTRPHKSKIALLRQVARTPRHLSALVRVGFPHYNLSLSAALYAWLDSHQMLTDQEVAWSEHRKYQFLIAPAGNTLSDRMRLLLPLNAVVLRVISTLQTSSTDFEELYTSMMRPWKEYVPVTPSNIKATVQKLRNEPALVRYLMDMQHRFVHRVLHYDTLLNYVQDLMWLLFGGCSKRPRQPTAATGCGGECANQSRGDGIIAGRQSMDDDMVDDHGGCVGRHPRTSPPIRLEKVLTWGPTVNERDADGFAGRPSRNGSCCRCHAVLQSQHAARQKAAAGSRHPPEATLKRKSKAHNTEQATATL